MNRTNVYSKGGKVLTTIVDLPDGYFYKGKFYKSVSTLFNALKAEGIAGSTRYNNGVWIYKDIWYTSLKELYEWNEDDFGIAYPKLARCYEEYGVTYSAIKHTMYYCTDDNEQELFDSKEAAICDYDYELSDYRILESADDIEERYWDDLTDEEIIAYSKKSVKQRIAILEQWQSAFSKVSLA